MQTVKPRKSGSAYVPNITSLLTKSASVDFSDPYAAPTGTTAIKHSNNTTDSFMTLNFNLEKQTTYLTHPNC